MMNKQRDTSLDIASGFCLIIVILGHIICFCKTTINFYVIVDFFCFYLAFFFFKAGLCFRAKDIIVELKSSFFRLIVPFICFSIIGIVLKIITDWQTVEWMGFITSVILNSKSAITDTIMMGAPSANLSLWFLPSLYVSRLIMTYIVQLNKIHQFVIALAIPVVYNLLLFSGFVSEVPYYFRNIPIGCSLMLYGFLLKNHTTSQFVLMSSFLVYIALLFILPSHLSVFGGSPQTGLFSSGYIALLTGCIAIYGGGQFIE